MGKKKIVLDTNILISALGWKGKPREIFKKVLNEEFELVISQKQIKELTNVMEYPKFKFTNNQKSKFIAILISVATVVKTYNKLKVIKEDPDDNIFLETAIENNVDYIVSGDEHLLKIKQFGKVKIVKASEFLKLLK